MKLQPDAFFFGSFFTLIGDIPPIVHEPVVPIWRDHVL